jgi:hypothetical protein
MIAPPISSFRVTPIVHPALPGGRLGLCPAPGRPIDGKIGDLESDLLALHCGAQTDVLVCLLGKHELASLGISALPERATAHGMRWIQSPIHIGDGPGVQLSELANIIYDLLASNQRVVVHDKTGHGRSGMVVSAVLVRADLSAEQAIEFVRATVPGAVEPIKQTGAVVEVALSLRQAKQHNPNKTHRKMLGIVPDVNTQGIIFCRDPHIFVSRSHNSQRTSLYHLTAEDIVCRELPDHAYGAFVTTADGAWLICSEGALSWPSQQFVPIPFELKWSIMNGSRCLWTSTFGGLAQIQGTSEKLIIIDSPPESFRSIHHLAETLVRPPGESINLRTVGCIGHPIGLVAAGGGRYLAVGGAGTGLIGYSRAERRAFYIDSQTEGHPAWVAGHPYLPLVALCSGKLEIFDLAQEKRIFLFEDGMKLCGDFSPNGEYFVFSSTMGVLSLRMKDLRLKCAILPSETGNLKEYQPVRFTPDGQFLFVPCRAGVAVYSTSLLFS